VIYDPVSVDSIGFALLASGVILCAWGKRSRRYFLPVLAIASAFMALTWLEPADLLALAAFLVPPYLLTKARWGADPDSGQGALIALLVWQVGLFILLRGYGPADIEHWINHPVAVIGLSYMLFRQIHMLIDAPDLGDLPLTPLHYWGYLAAFWTFLAGPIQRYEDFCDGLEEIGRPDIDAQLEAGHRIANGLILGFLIAPLFLPTQNLALLREEGADWLDFVIVFYSFPIYLYLNFTGYTDVMIGVSRLTGMTTMPENFNRPFLARNIQDFWARWHISLSTWIGHYVFNPLNATIMRRVDPSWHKLAMAGALYVTFFVVGMWHGTTLNFFYFGLAHATGVLVNVAYGAAMTRWLGREKRKAVLAHPVMHWGSVFLCINYICATMFVVNYDLTELAQTMKVFLGY
jgi:D-alanyl-lipoteichoic acid acyltransferase DltB (MBOAT superfamily)